VKTKQSSNVEKERKNDFLATQQVERKGEFEFAFKQNKKTKTSKKHFFLFVFFFLSHLKDAKL